MPNCAQFVLFLVGTLAAGAATQPPGATATPPGIAAHAPNQYNRRRLAHRPGAPLLKRTRMHVTHKQHPLPASDSIKRVQAFCKRRPATAPPLPSSSKHAHMLTRPPHMRHARNGTLLQPRAISTGSKRSARAPSLRRRSAAGRMPRSRPWSTFAFGTMATDQGPIQHVPSFLPHPGCSFEGTAPTMLAGPCLPDARLGAQVRHGVGWRAWGQLSPGLELQGPSLLAVQRVHPVAGLPGQGRRAHGVQGAGRRSAPGCVVCLQTLWQTSMHALHEHPFHALTGTRQQTLSPSNTFHRRTRRSTPLRRMRAWAHTAPTRASRHLGCRRRRPSCAASCSCPPAERRRPIVQCAPMN